MFFLQKFFFTKKNQTLNIETTKFIDSETQRTYIEEQINLFIAYRDKQFEIDKKILMAGCGLGLDALLWCVRLPTTVAMLIAGGIVVYAIPFAMRQQVAEQFNTQLEKLIKIYHWCEKGNGPKITHNATFLNVLEVIAPFINTKEVKLWPFRETRPEDISMRFADIIAKPPHKIEMVMLKANEHTTLDQLFSMKKESGSQDEAPSMNVTQTENHWSRLFDQSVAEVTRALYGPKIEEPKLKPM